MDEKVRKNRFLVPVLLILLTLGMGGVFLHSLFAERYLQSANDAIQTGKTQLFSRSVSGALLAYQTFQTAAAGADYSAATPAQKIKIHAYLAFTRMVDILLREDGGSTDTLAELLAKYGATRTGDAFDSVKFTPPPLNDDGKVILPATAPASAEALRAFFAGPFFTAVNASIHDLDEAISLSPTDGSEGDDREIIAKALINSEDTTQPDVEMDAGDYYLFRAFLKFLKGYALMCAGNNATLDIREVVAMVNMGPGQEMFKKILDRYPDFLKISDASKMNEARLALIDAITDYETASAKIRGDISTQAGAEELISLDITELAKENFLREQMALAKNSLQNNTAVALGGAEEWWNFSILTPELKTFSVALEDSFSSGSYSAYGNTGCDTKFGCNARLEYALVNGNNVTLRFNYYYPYYGWSEFHGTLNAAKTQITNGTYNGYNPYSGTGSYSGTFSAMRTYFEANTERFNLFPLFGDGAATQPKALRDLLPKFNEFGYPLPGTMGHGLSDDPTLGGILPDFATQDRWLKEFEGNLFTPTGPLTIPQVDEGAIAIDGATDDWTDAGITTPVLTDVTGERGQYMAANGDLQKVFLAIDSQYLYIRMELAGDWNSQTGQNFMYGLRFRQSPGDGPDKPGDIKLFARNRDGVWEVKAQSIQTNGQYGPLGDLSANGGAVAASGKVVEWRVRRGSSVAGWFLAADTDSWNYYQQWDYGWYSYDKNPTCLQFQPTASVTGTLSVPGYDGSGPVRVGVFEYGPDFSTNPEKRLGSLAIYPDYSGTLPATYAITGLPVGKKSFVSVFWDRDGNGVVSPGDYTNFYQPFTTVSGDNTRNLAVADDHPAYSPPEFQNVRISSRKLPNGNRIVDFLSTLMGPSPEDVTITATGPGGEYKLSPAIFSHQLGLVYMISVPWLMDGDYTFTAVDSRGRKAETTYSFQNRYDLPSLSISSSPTYAGTTTPTLTWTPPAGGPYAYQVLVQDINGAALWYMSDRTAANSVTVPAGMLLPDSHYFWFVRVFDDAGHPMNCTESNYGYFYTGARAENPAAEWVSIGARPPTGTSTLYSFWVDAKVPGLAPWDVTAIRLKDPSGNIVIQRSGSPNFDVRFDQSYFEASSSPASPPVSGLYTFEMDFLRSSQTRTIAVNNVPFNYSSVQAVDITTLVPSNNYYFKTTTPTFSWGLVAEQNTYYRVRVFDPMGRKTIWQSFWSKNTSATVRAGVLKPGGTYYWTVVTTPAIDPSNVSAFVNTEGNASNRMMYRFTLEPPRKGDVSGNGEVNLEDAVLALQVVSGFKPLVTLTGDVNNDGRIGLPEALYILQFIGDSR
ncbi:MAG: dockerin type I repeat-containing protein [Syntrophales bacterium]